MGAKDLMRKVHQQGKLQQTKPNSVAVQPEPIREIVQQPIQVEKPVQVKNVDSVKHTSDLPTAVKKIARPDIPIDTYGINSWKSNFDIYNKEVVKFIRNFSANNQLNGGNAITKSQLIEVVLDVMIYDLGLQPLGFESPKALREYIQEQLKK
jgi:hypothetical protein